MGGENKLHPFTLLTLQNKTRGEWSRTEPKVLKERYQTYHRAVKLGLIRGAHDVSEGGTLTALIEMSINSELGFNLNLSNDTDLFGEGMGMIVFSSAFNQREKIQTHFKNIKRIGTTRDDQIIIVGLEQMNLQECLHHFKGANS